MNAMHDLPPITVSTRDFDRLVAFGLDAYVRGDQQAEFLLAEMRRATLCPPGDLPEEVVSIDCRVVYRLDEEPRVRGGLVVHPLDLKGGDEELSASSPLGAALLGLRVGDRMPFHDGRSGRVHVVTVEGVGWRWTGTADPAVGAGPARTSRR